MPDMDNGIAEKIGKWIAIGISLGTFVWGVNTTLGTWAINARRPFLDLQLKLYQEATETAALLATTTEGEERAKAESRFWELYCGELAMVENGGLKVKHGGVEDAMVHFGDVLKKRPHNLETLQTLSIRLAHACRDSLAESWRVQDWKSPDYGRPNNNASVTSD